jgi:ABC-type uncharacterized transport system, periplasmic component
MTKNANSVKNIIGICAAAFFVTALFAPAVFSQSAKTVTILLSGKLQQYKEAVDGFKDALKQEGASVSYQEFILSPDAGSNDALKKKLAALPGDLLFTVGTQASLFAKKELSGTPVVFSMVLNPVENGVAESVDSPGPGMTGVCLNIPVEIQLKTLKEIKPSLKRVGILCGAKSNLMIISDAEKAAKRLGFDLLVKSVFSEGDISQALGEVLSGADCLWAYPDPMIYNPSTAQKIIMDTLKDNIAFMAFSRSYVKAGALAAVECDYRDIGRQSAGMAQRMLKGGGEDISIEYPRKTILVVNKRTADMIGLDIPKDILNRAEIYGN